MDMLGITDMLPPHNVLVVLILLHYKPLKFVHLPSTHYYWWQETSSSVLML